MPHSAESKFHRYKSHQTAAQRRSGPPANSALRRSIETSDDVISLDKAESYKMSSFLSGISEVTEEGGESSSRPGPSSPRRVFDRTGVSDWQHSSPEESSFARDAQTSNARARTRRAGSALPRGRGRRALLNQQVQFVQIDRFDQMMFESSFVTLADVFFHPKTG